MLWMLIPLIAIALVIAGLVGWRWWTHADAFEEGAAGFKASPRPVAEAALTTTVIMPKDSGEVERITIKGLDATFDRNGAAAKATFGVCHMSQGQDPIGFVHDPAEACANLEPVELPMEFTYGVAPDSDYLTVTITPRKPGTARLTGVTIDYERPDHFDQRGEQILDLDTTVTAR